MLFRVLDIETIPDLRFCAKLQPTVKLTAYERIGGFGSLFEPAVSVEPAFPPPQAHRVVAISYVDIVFDPTLKPMYQFQRFYTKCEWDHDVNYADILEKELLREFGESVSTTPGGPVHFVSWNGRTFDLPVISLRSLLHKIPCKWYYEGKDLRYRYATEGHNDLMDYLSDYGACRQMTLADACHLMGLPGKLDMTGASVESLFFQTKHMDDGVRVAGVKRDVEKYCLQDSIQTALAFIRTRYHLGKVSAESHNAILDTFVEAVDPIIKIEWDRIKV